MDQWAALVCDGECVTGENTLTVTRIVDVGVRDGAHDVVYPPLGSRRVVVTRAQLEASGVTDQTDMADFLDTLEWEQLG